MCLLFLNFRFIPVFVRRIVRFAFTRDIAPTGTDIIFFAVSGYCLTNVKKSFPSWYGKRVLRCYTPVVIMTAIYMILGFYSLSDHNGFWWYVYPTYYHFVASIIVLYIPFYLIMKVDFLKKNIPWIMVFVGVVYGVVYLFGKRGVNAWL